MEKQTNQQAPAPQKNPPVSTPAGVKKEGKNPPTKKGGGISFVALFAIFMAIILFFIGIFYVLMLWALFNGDVNNPLFEALGILDQDLQNTLHVITHTVFGILVVIFLINFLIGMFRAVSADRKDVRRRGYFQKSIVSFLIMIGLSGAWSFLYVIIRDARVESLVDTEMIKTEPAVTANLSAPVQIKFNIGDALYRKIDRTRVKQINWDFDGDGQYDASGPEVFFEFKNKGKNNGRYTAQATIVYAAANGPTDETFETSREIVIVNESIAAEILSSTQEGPAPLRVNFNGGGSYDPDGSVVYYEWDFNDDGIYDVVGENESKVENVFQKIGQYKVRLRVRGSNSDYDEAETTINVTNPEQNMQARITGSQSREGVAPYEVILSGDSSFSRTGRIIKYTWYIQGEDEVIPSRTMKWKFSTPGEYLVRLVIENDLGEKEEDEILISVKAPIKDSNLIIDTTPSTIEQGVLTGVAPFEATFDSQRSTLLNAIEWQWDFNSDGIVDAYDKAATYTFREKGAFEVTLKMIDVDGDEFTKVLPVNVISAGVKALTTATPIAGTVPLTVRFDGSASSADEAEIINYIWQFPGKNPIPYGAQITYEFPIVGVYEVKLTVLTDKNETATTSTFISVRAQPLEIDFNPSVYSGKAPLEVIFDSSLSKGDIAEYRWDFGDGIIDRSGSPIHVYNNPGVYEVSLQVKDLNGIVDTKTKTITVE